MEDRFLPRRVAIGNINNEDKPNLLVTLTRVCTDACTSNANAGRGFASILEVDATGAIVIRTDTAPNVHGLRDMLGHGACVRIAQSYMLGLTRQTISPAIMITAVSMLEEAIHTLWALQQMAIEQARLDVTVARCSAVVMSHIGKTQTPDLLPELRALCQVLMEHGSFMQTRAWPPPKGKGFCACGKH